MSENKNVQQTQEVTLVATLPFGKGEVGEGYHLRGDVKEEYLQSLARNQHQIPDGLWLPIDCMDDRPTLGLADGTTDPEQLKNRRAGQLPGGTVLATVKALIAADAALLKDATSVKHAYELTYDTLTSLGVPDAAHAGCGASNFVQLSVAERLDTETVVRTFAALGAAPDDIRPSVSVLDQNKARRLESGFYADWDAAWHADFVSSRQPQNFSYLVTQPDAVHGHHASGLVLVRDGHYFAKNAFVEETGAMAFALTLGEADRLARLLGQSDEERNLISLAYRDDAFNVANHIVATGLEVAA